MYIYQSHAQIPQINHGVAYRLMWLCEQLSKYPAMAHHTCSIKWWEWHFLLTFATVLSQKSWLCPAWDNLLLTSGTRYGLGPLTEWSLLPVTVIEDEHNLGPEPEKHVPLFSLPVQVQVVMLRLLLRSSISVIKCSVTKVKWYTFSKLCNRKMES